jgi:hypothetical protein
MAEWPCSSTEQEAKLHDYWSIFLEYDSLLETTGSGQETKGLTEAGKLCYEKLRVWRREIEPKVRRKKKACRPL